VVLNCLHQRQAPGLGIALDGQIQEHNLGMGAMYDIVYVFELDFEILGRVVAAVNNGGNAARSAQLFGARSAA
jgi:hypothetical protein